MCLFAATYPNGPRRSFSVAVSPEVRSADYAEGSPARSTRPSCERSRTDGRPGGIDFRAPSRVDDARFRDNWARYPRPARARERRSRSHR